MLVITYSFRFFPAAGFRKYDTVQLGNRGNCAWYWCSSVISETHGWRVFLGNANTSLAGSSRAQGFTVRCVAQRGLAATAAFNCSLYL